MRRDDALHDAPKIKTLGLSDIVVKRCGSLSMMDQLAVICRSGSFLKTIREDGEGKKEKKTSVGSWSAYGKQNGLSVASPRRGLGDSDAGGDDDDGAR